MVAEAVAQPPPMPLANPGPVAPVAEGMVSLDLPPEVELSTLVEYISRRLNQNIVYGAELANKKVTVRAPAQIPVESLLPLLDTVLRMNSLALVPADAPGFLRIVKADALAGISRPLPPDQPLTETSPGEPITQIFTLDHLDPTAIERLITPFLTPQQSSVLALKDQRVLIVTDYSDRLQRLADLIQRADRPPDEVVYEFLPVEHLEAAAVADQARALLGAKRKAQGLGPQATSGVEVSADVRTNQLVLVGTREQVTEVKDLVRSLDVPLGLTTEVYSFQSVSAERVDDLVRNLMDPLQLGRLYRSTVDSEGNLLVVTTTPEQHQRIAELRRSLDRAEQRPPSRVQYYKLENVTAEELLPVVRSIMGIDTFGGGRGDRRPNRFGGSIGNEPPFPGFNPFIPGAQGDQIPTPPIFRESSYQQQQPEATAVPQGTGVPGPPGMGMPFPGPGGGGWLSPYPLPIFQPGLLGQVQIIPDPATNSLIVIAEPETQRQLADLIERLDRRRPQVMIEAKIVIIDTSDGFSLGVELSGGDGLGLDRAFAFTQFGLSQVNPVTGALQIIPGSGFNATVVESELADVVVRALATHDRARITSAPRIVVNDNATGTLESVDQEPFASINASETVSTTSQGGFVDAGTTINVTPHVSSANYIQLEFEVALSTFTGPPRGEGLSPPRQTNRILSDVTLPDGYTVIVGGLNTTAKTTAIQGVPWLEKIPVLKYAFSTRTNTNSNSSLFIFLRPVILKEDQFRDLKLLTDFDLHNAAAPGQYPASQPQLMHGPPPVKVITRPLAPMPAGPLPPPK
jgi:type II secretory pathway component GspD/PulD (secretin)